MYPRPIVAGLLSCLLLAASPLALAEPAASPAVAAPTPARELEALLQQGRAEQAYARGQALFAEQAGEPGFDFQLGLAALAVGRYDHAALAFRRVLMAEPASDRARVELARALFLAGNDAAARAEFEQVLRRDPPPPVAARVQQFLDAIDRRAQGRQAKLTPSLGLRLGHDDNVGNATDREVFLVALPGIPLTVEREEDSFFELAAALEYQRPIDKHWGLFAAGGYTHRGYRSAEGFDLGALDLRGGLVRAEGGRRLRLPVQVQALRLDGEQYRSLFSVGAEWSRALGARTELTAFGQALRVSYPDLPLFDVDGLNAGVLLGHRAANGLRLSGGLFAGKEDAAESAGEHNGRDFLGLRLTLAWPFMKDHTLEAVAALQDVDYAAAHPMFARVREDRVRQLELAWQWLPAERWEWRTALLHYDSDSSISLYDYDRLQLITGVRYVWK